jgi:hypothetical protein
MCQHFGRYTGFINFYIALKINSKTLSRRKVLRISFLKQICDQQSFLQPCATFTFIERLPGKHDETLSIVAASRSALSIFIAPVIQTSCFSSTVLLLAIRLFIEFPSSEISSNYLSSKIHVLSSTSVMALQ